MSTAPYLATAPSRPREEADRLGDGRRAPGAQARTCPSRPTRAASVPARAALEAGARVINDVTGPHRRPGAGAAGGGGGRRPRPDGLRAAGAAARRATGRTRSATVRRARSARGEPQRSRAEAGIDARRVSSSTPASGSSAAGRCPGTSGTAACWPGSAALRALGRPVCVGRLAEVVHRRHAGEADPAEPPAGLAGRHRGGGAGRGPRDPGPRRGRDRCRRCGWPQAIRRAPEDRRVNAGLARAAGRTGGTRSTSCCVAIVLYPRLRHVQGHARRADGLGVVGLVAASLAARRLELFRTSWLLDNFWSFWVLALHRPLPARAAPGPRPDRARARCFRAIDAGPRPRSRAT